MSISPEANAQLNQPTVPANTMDIPLDVESGSPPPNAPQDTEAVETVETEAPLESDAPTAAPAISRRQTNRKALLIELDFVLFPGLDAAFRAASTVFGGQGVAFDDIVFARCLAGRPLARGCTAADALDKKKIDAASCAQSILETLTTQLQQADTPWREAVSQAAKGIAADEVTLAFLTRLPAEAAWPLLERAGFDQDSALLSVTATDRLASFSAESWKRAVHTLHLNPHRTAALAASGASTKSALAAGLRVLAIREPLTAFQDYSGADYILDAPSDSQALTAAIRSSLRLEETEA